MSEFKSESFNLFHQFHTRLNNYVKISTASIDHLNNYSANKNDLASKINELILNSGERWSPKIYENPMDEVLKIKNDLSQSSIMWVYSSFDVFLNHVHSSYSDHKVNSDYDSKECYNDIVRLKKLFTSFNWEINDLEYLLVLYDYYALIRHCVVHNMGKPTKELIKISISKEFLKAMSTWPTKVANRNLSPAPTITSTKISLMPHHAITYSEVCFRIAKIINSNILKTVGVKFYIRKTAKKFIQDSTHLTKPVSNNSYNFIINKIFENYNLKSVKIDEIKSAFSEEELKEINKTYLKKKNII
ncbi:hypothetical protein [Flavobacterium bizetiae]|uniref:hypothetical protein n=1 Tax=Flavobacterium bizetiae TaxID=2704140 RepID=UPI0037573C20